MAQASDAWLTCRDGVRLVSRIWRPGQGEGPWPVLLMRQPYGRAIASTPTYAHPAWYADQGFLVVVQDVRGQGDSEGDFSGFAQEARDGADTIRWARQLPGSSGRLGCYGFSYQGLTQLLSDSTDPAAWPDCLAPAMAGLDERLHWASSGGAHWWALGLGWGLQLAALRCRRRGDAEGWQQIRRSLESGRFLEEGAALLQRHDPGGMAWSWLQRDAGSSAGWRQHRPAPALLQRPLLLIGGWHDPHLEGVLELWQLAQAAGAAPLLRIGAWTHLNWGEGLDALQLAFFRRHLLQPDQPPDQPPEPSSEQRPAGRSGDPASRAKALGSPEAPERLNHLEQPLLLQRERGGHWWTPEELSAAPGAPGLEGDQGGLRCWLAAAGPGRGRLLPRAPAAAEAGALHLVHDPWRPVPGRGGHLGLDAGSCERGDLDGRRDVLCFDGPLLEQPLQLAVRPLLELAVHADQPAFDLCAALSRLDGHGRVQQLCTGVRRQLGSAAAAAPQPAGELATPQRLQLVLQPLLLDLQPGERLRLSLAAAAWPQIAVNPGSGEPPRGGSGPRHRVITLTLQLAGAQLTLQPLLTAPAAIANGA